MSEFTLNLKTWHQRIFLLTSGAIILGYLAGLQLSQSTQLLLLLTAVAVTGLPHGALDPLVARRAKLWQKGSGLLAFSILYLLIAGAAFSLWMFFPDTTLASLIALSVWHFSGDWRSALPRVQCLAMSAAVICAPALWHRTEVNEIFSHLTSTNAHLFSSFMVYLAPLSILTVLIALVRKKNSDVNLLIEFAILMLAAAVLPPLIFFLVYFCLLHSPRHLLEVTQGFTPAEVTSYGVVFTAMSLCLAVATFFLLPDTGISERLTQVLFIGLLVLTVPHMLIIEHASKRDTLHSQRRTT
ncbi:MAG: Brp/Blh family beta-carotene 15,15'-monooxygenase [Pseudohongiellaceae bacterium]